MIPKELSERSALGINQVKAKTLYIIFFIILFIVSLYLFKYMYKFVINYIITWRDYSIDILMILFYLIVFIPLTAFFAEKLASLAARKGLGKDKNFKIFIVSVIIIPILLFSFYNYNDYREKSLNEVIRINTNKVDYIIINDKLMSDNKEYVEELNEFLSQYRVEKMKDHEWNSDVSKERGFKLTIYSNDKPFMANIYENRLNYLNSGEYYKVLNGPIDMEWVEEMYEKLEKIERPDRPK